MRGVKKGGEMGKLEDERKKVSRGGYQMKVKHFNTIFHTPHCVTCVRWMINRSGGWGLYI